MFSYRRLCFYKSNAAGHCDEPDLRMLELVQFGQRTSVKHVIVKMDHIA